MKVRIVTAALVALTYGATAWAADASAKSPQQSVDERVAGMKKMAGDIKAASEATDAAASKAKIGEAKAFAESIPSLFPKGTGIGDPGVTKSRALQDIWAKPAEFKAAANALAAALGAVDAALGGDKAQVDAAFAGVRKSCGGCHTPFRGPETEQE